MQLEVVEEESKFETFPNPDEDYGLYDELYGRLLKCRVVDDSSEVFIGQIIEIDSMQYLIQVGGNDYDPVSIYELEQEYEYQELAKYTLLKIT